ncbi:ATP-binding protein [Spirochaeta lutea]|uniref:ATP-binding protein n=1 Tax=Spirochaeta lutea TaxID=1480694 RepID=UPI00056B59F3|nr:ATP-binding protein [Spirochaeta lutea]
MTSRKTNLFVNLITSGKEFDPRDPSAMDGRIRYIMLNTLIILGGSLLFLFGYQSLQAGAGIQAAFDIAMGLTTLVGFFLLRSSAPFIISGFLTVVPYMFLCGFLTFGGGVQGSGVLWAFSFPIIAVFVLGMQWGSMLAGLLGVFLGVTVLLPGLAQMDFQTGFALRAIGVYLLIFASTIVYERTKMNKDIQLAALNRRLQVERDEITAMKDNLKDGIFLINEEYQIQPNYSPSAARILDVPDLSGMSLPGLLTSSLKDKELQSVQDYFDMVRQRSFDEEMLLDINPLHEFTYQPTHGGEPRILACSFAPVDREDGQVQILCLIKDQTREVELTRQLSEEEAKRQEEMQSLFEVIHVDPRVFDDFIQDTDYELEQINQILKDSRTQTQAAMVQTFQGVHAIKSNAVILGLQNFGQKLHTIEQDIANLRENPDITFQDTLRVTLQLEDIYRSLDVFKTLIGKIRSFKSGEIHLQGEHVLIKTLEKVAEKAASAQGKQVRLEIDALEPHILEDLPRRELKEILVQLVRNAVYHGIEPPDQRSSSGKPGQGTIRLSITRTDDHGIITLEDDGRGLNLESIRQKALSLGLLRDSDGPHTPSSLFKLLFSPGFSTAGQADLHAGRGVGLSLVRDRLKSVQGRVKIQQEEHRGTRFCLHIPLLVQEQTREDTA